MALICPKCLSDMSELDHQGVTIDVCPGCRGIWLDPGELAMLRGAAHDLPSGPEQLTAGPRHMQTTTYICPRCDGGFESFEYAEGTGLIIDRCQECKGIYLDVGELQKVRAITDNQRRLGVESPDAADRNLRDLIRAESGRNKRERNLAPGDSSAGVYFFQLLTGLPVEVDAPRQRFPWVVLGLIVACAATFIYQLTLPAEAMGFYREYAFVPQGLFEQGATLGLVTSLFLHGGWLHLLGNMYFLWLFGDNVEDRLNRGLFLAFYLICGIVAAAIHGVLTAHPELPTLGASGAISGIMGAYLVLYPRRQMYQVLWFIQFRISVVFYLLLWLGMQILLSAAGSGGVAWFAHIGGFAAGAAGIWLLKSAGLLRPDPFVPERA